MDTLRLVLRIAHIGFGMVGLLAFWVPVFAKKGGPVHLRFGKIFVWCAYGVAGSGGLSVAMHLSMMAMSGRTPFDAPNNYSFLILLGYLALITFVTVRFAVAVARAKQQNDLLRTAFFRSMIGLCILGSLTVASTALIIRPVMMVLLLALSPIGLLMARDIYIYLYRTPKTKRDWFYAHMGNMLGGGVAFHTAFAVFGFARLTGIHIEGAAALIPWILPTAIGVPGMLIWERAYRKKFGDLPVKRTGHPGAGEFRASSR